MAIDSNTFDTLAEAYREGLKDLLAHGRSVPSVNDPLSTASGFGGKDRPSIELIGYSFRVMNPLSSLFIAEARQPRIPYCIGLLAWSLKGSDDLESLSYYNPFAKEYSDDNSTLCGAFGKRLFNYDDRIDQIGVLLDRLTADPTSRRTFAAICTPEDNVRASREYPCCIGVQYFVRNGALHSTTYMRAQSAMVVLPYDAFLFMSLHCFVAAKLGVTPGSYQHFVGTFHIYETEREQAEKLLNSQILPVSVPRMDSSVSDWHDFFIFETSVRLATSTKDVDLARTLYEQCSNNNTFIEHAKVILCLHSSRNLDLAAESESLLELLTGSAKQLLSIFEIGER